MTPWTAARQASLSFTISWSLLKFMFTESVILSNWSCNFTPGYLSEENENTNLKIYMHPNVQSKCSYFSSSSICQVHVLWQSLPRGLGLTKVKLPFRSSGEINTCVSIHYHYRGGMRWHKGSSLFYPVVAQKGYRRCEGGSWRISSSGWNRGIQDRRKVHQVGTGASWTEGMRWVKVWQGTRT